MTAVPKISETERWKQYLEGLWTFEYVTEQQKAAIKSINQDFILGTNIRFPIAGPTDDGECEIYFTWKYRDIKHKTFTF